MMHKSERINDTPDLLEIKTNKINAIIDNDKIKNYFLKHVNAKRKFLKLNLNDVQIRAINSNDCVVYNLKTEVVSHEINDSRTIKTEARGTIDECIRKACERFSTNENSKEDFEEYFTLPNTENQQLCHACHGSKHVKCNQCSGTGNQTCVYCYGNNQVQDCVHCGGDTFIKCKSCTYGSAKCSTCNGLGEVIWYKELRVKKSSLQDEYVKCTEKAIPRKFLQSCKGEIIFNKKAKNLLPISHFPDSDINSISEKYLSEHVQYSKLKNDLLINQSHQIYVIPIRTCVAMCKKKPIIFHLVGKDYQIYVEKTNSSCSVF